MCAVVFIAKMDTVTSAIRTGSGALIMIFAVLIIIIIIAVVVVVIVIIVITIIVVVIVVVVNIDADTIVFITRFCRAAHVDVDRCCRRRRPHRAAM